MRERKQRSFSVEHADAILAGPLSEDLPENIDAIEEEVMNAYINGKLDFHDLSDESHHKLEVFLHSKGLMPDWDIRDLASKVFRRVYLGRSSWELLKNIKKDQNERYERLKDRPSVKKVVSLGGLSQETMLVITSIENIDNMLSNGCTYNDVFTSLGFDHRSSNHAFLNHAEEKFNLEIKSADQLQELTGVGPEYKNDIEDSYLVALTSRYHLALDKCLSNGGKYKDLLKINPQDFRLPEIWSTELSGEMSKERSILQAINNRYNLDDSRFYRIPLRIIASQLEAPYNIILEASRYYE